MMDGYILENLTQNRLFEYSESISEKKANHLSESIINDIKQFLK